MKTRKKAARAGSARGLRREPAGRFFTLAEVADAVGGHLVGEGGLRLSGVESLDRAGPRDISWVAQSRRAREARETRAGALLVAARADAVGRPCVVVENPALAMALWQTHWGPESRPAPGIARGAHVHASALLAAGVSVAAGATVAARARVGARTVIGAGSYIGEEAEIGQDCRLYPLSAVLERCRVGSRCILHAGAVVGSDGFGYVWDGAAHRKIPQKGIVRVEDDVEIGANSAIDRATFGETVIGRGTKIDNLVQIGHNVIVGEHSILCGQAGVAGSSRLGRGVTLAGQVGVGDHAEIGDGAIATGQAGVVTGGTIAPGAVVSGMPAAPHREFLRRAAWLARLPQLARRVEELETKQRGRKEG